MRLRLPTLLRLNLFLFLALLGVVSVAAHDLSASYATLRFKPDTLQLEVKVAAETAWSQVQAKIAPGEIFVMEDFEKVGKPLLLKFAKTMEELTVDHTVVEPRETNVAVVEDNFIFTFTYPRPARAAVLKEKYISQMPSDYVSRVVVVDAKNEVAVSKTLHPTNVVFEFTTPAAAPVEKKSDAPASR